MIPFALDRRAVAALLATAALWLAGSAQAAGTAAGTDISNQATATYTVDAQQRTENSNVETVRVAELLDVEVTLQSAGNVPVVPGASNQVLSFRITNTGNGSDSYTLAGLSTLAGDDYDPTFADIILDDGDGVYEAGVDPQYVAGTNDPALAADGELIVFLLNDIPTPLADGLLGNSQLTATSNTGTGVPGTVIVGGGDGGTIDAVVGTNEGDDADLGTYVTVTAAVTLTKSSVVSNPFGGGSEPVPGSTITYTIVVSTSGTGTAQTVVVRDAIPANTTYQPNSMTLNAGALTDGSDSPTDEADFNVTNPGEITVGLGDLTGGGPDQTITFDVVID